MMEWWRVVHEAGQQPRARRLLRMVEGEEHNQGRHASKLQRRLQIYFTVLERR